MPVSDTKAHPIVRLGLTTTYLNSQMFTSGIGDVELMASHFGAQAPNQAFMLCDLAEDASLEDAAGCSTQSKLDVMLERCTRDLAVFERVSWSAGKESWFTKPLSKLHCVKGEASHLGKKHIVDTCQSWVSVLSALAKWAVKFAG